MRLTTVKNVRSRRVFSKEIVPKSCGHFILIYFSRVKTRELCFGNLYRPFKICTLSGSKFLHIDSTRLGTVTVILQFSAKLWGILRARVYTIRQRITIFWNRSFLHFRHSLLSQYVVLLSRIARNARRFHNVPLFFFFFEERQKFRPAVPRAICTRLPVGEFNLLIIAFAETKRKI